MNIYKLIILETTSAELYFMFIVLIF